MQINYCDIGTPPTEADNGNHPPTTDDPWWQESCVFTWGDPRRGFGGELRWGMHPNQGKASLYAWIVWEGKNIYRKIIPDQPLPKGDLFDSTIAGATIKTIKPLMEFDLAFKVEGLEVRLRWTNFHHPVSLRLGFGGSNL